MIKEYSVLGFPFTSQEIRTIAYEFAEEHGITGFSDQKEIAGPKWFSLFLKRHDDIRVKHGATNLSLSRALGSTKQIVENWFDQYQNLVESLGITDPSCIWNIDEHGSEDMHKSRRVIGIKGIKQFQIQPREKPRRTTMLTYVNAAGFALPPMVIHRGKYHDSWRIDAPRRVLVRGSKKGYINKKLFAEYGKMLIYHLHATGYINKPNLILMDSHYSHVFNYCYMSMMFERNIKVFPIEPHSSHWGQPLDKNPFSGFKHAFNETMRKFNRSTGGRGITKQEFFSVFNVAWEKAMTPANIKAGFKRTGIWPVNRAAIPQYVLEPGEKMSESLHVWIKFQLVLNVYYTICLLFFSCR